MELPPLWELGREQAKLILDSFLREESKAAHNLVEQAQYSGIVADFSLSSLSDVMKWGLANVRTKPKAADKNVPEWIRNTDSYKNNLYEMDEPSGILMFRMAYYLGECFVRAFPALRWDIGDNESALCNMPVITGFPQRQEMPPIKIVENLYGRILSGAAGNEAIDIALQRWREIARG